ncbi:hypothetical protein [Butyrivibrio sp. INlla21]|uniref:hypothetical protein n=1 Tax=Butyrivibrio sp. INlla21 TaxID=1520811 RepID=UPI0008E1D764|nr:hypothetical protein [Butyrivibrio sp. INlla21]SFU69852.1 hypothetical protein SAMN02910342_01404 [Butyrivibrio sp. INlla21]
MRRKGMKIFAGIAAAMLAVTGLVGAVTKAQVQGIETVETTEYKVEKNESSLTKSDNSPTKGREELGISEISEIPKLKDHADNVVGFSQILYSKCFDGVVIVSEQKNYIYPEGGQYWFFTRKNGEKKVRCAGYLCTNQDLRYKDGVFYACNIEGPDEEEAFETYLISPDGKSIVHKDYVNSDLWGFTNDSNIESKRVAFEGDLYDYYDLWDIYYNKAKDVVFTK